ncbi:hypothetical protein [Dipodfec virus UA06Rod_16]|uniref:Uncharacterized protein n=1 Tax=Dipodfec virus UA06Rod_16 TaxID=2929317 RepID=A0A976R842_9VIRU|nr:hypothetical protein [Dipodfec virus UA06Rod_16]
MEIIWNFLPLIWIVLTILNDLLLCFIQKRKFKFNLPEQVLPIIDKLSQTDSKIDTTKVVALLGFIGEKIKELENNG